MMETAEPAQAKDSLTPDSRQQPLWHVVVLSLLTCTAYCFYWFYKNWRDLSAEAAAQLREDSLKLAKFHNISPLLRAIGLVVPVWNIYLVLMQLKGIAELYPRAESFPRRRPLVAATLVLLGFIAVLGLGALPGVFYLLSLLAGFPLAIAQSWLNEFWRSVEPANRPVRFAFTVKELAALIVGSAWLGLIVVGMMMMPKP